MAGWFGEKPEVDSQAIADYKKQVELAQQNRTEQHVRTLAVDYALRLTDIVAKNAANLDGVDLGTVVITSAEKFTQYILDGQVKKERKRK